ncbi:hypothetical protein BC332_23354 [Capsicum chinense]|nr:hypothetical protein BC332_23354 [Capsicum chinense]
MMGRRIVPGTLSTESKNDGQKNLNLRYLDFQPTSFHDLKVEEIGLEHLVRFGGSETSQLSHQVRFKREEIEGDVEEKLQKMVEEVLLAIMHVGDLPLKITKSFLRTRDTPFSENLVNILDIQLHGPSSIQKTDLETECGICYAPYLPIEVEVALIVHVKNTAAVGPSTMFALEIGCVPSQQEGNKWNSPILVLIVTVFDDLFGNCPYCSDPIAVKINSKK